MKARAVRGAATPIHTADPRAAYLAHSAELDAAIQSALRQPHYVLGPVVEQFEHEFAAFVGSAHGVGVNSGTDALQLALRALGVGPGELDEAAGAGLVAGEVEYVEPARI